jgi:hypothetical protein
MIDTHIGNRSDAVRLIENVVKSVEQGWVDEDMFLDVLEAIKDAIQKEVI